MKLKTTKRYQSHLMENNEQTFWPSQSINQSRCISTPHPPAIQVLGTLNYESLRILSSQHFRLLQSDYSQTFWFQVFFTLLRAFVYIGSQEWMLDFFQILLLHLLILHGFSFSSTNMTTLTASVQHCTKLCIVGSSLCKRKK